SSGCGQCGRSPRFSHNQEGAHERGPCRRRWSSPCSSQSSNGGEKGLSTAVIRGWQAARGEVLAVIDADLQHPAEPIWNDLWTFGDLAEKQGYGMARLRRFAKFNGICAAGLVLR